MTLGIDHSNLIKPSLVLTSAYARERAQGAMRTKANSLRQLTLHCELLLLLLLCWSEKGPDSAGSKPIRFHYSIFLPFLSFMVSPFCLPLDN